MRVAFELVKSKEASSVISPGNTGAMMAAGLSVFGTLPGIARPAIASLIPKVGDLTPTVLIDSGANTDCHAYQLVQFALMGNYYARSVLGCEQPRVALLSNGTEISKGTDIIRSAALTLSELGSLNFIGYVEGRDIPRDVADVVVCDGFIGNVLLKAMEGTAELVIDSIKHYVVRTLRGKIGMWLAKPALKSLFHDKLDPSAYGGAPLLGLNDIAIVCHGSSNSRAIMNGIRAANKFVSESLVLKMSGALSALDVKMPGQFQDGIWDRMGQRFDKKKKLGDTAKPVVKTEPGDDDEVKQK
jgi:glycerol-3-phosphate acyltransferase PlsX